MIFELLGIRVLDRGGTWMTTLVDPDVADFSNNACYTSEVTPEQWALEQTLAAVLASDGADAEGVGPAATRTSTACTPSRSDPSTSASASTRTDDFDATLDRVRTAATDPELAGRVALSGVFHADEPGAAAPNIIQAFIRTDIHSWAGMLAFGQHVELQWHLPARVDDLRSI